MDRFMSSNDQASFSEKSETKCCYVCLEDSQDQLQWIGHKLRAQLTECNIHVLQNDATPKYLCHSCRTDIKDSCELLNRVRNALAFWREYSENLGVPVKKLKLPQIIEEKVVIDDEEELTNQKKKRKRLPTEKDKNIKKFYRCHLCLEKFSYQMTLKSHMWLVHFKNKDRPECCVVCGVTFQSTEKCRTHFFGLHFNNNLVCDMCGKSGMTDPQFRFHLRAIHGTNPTKMGLSLIPNEEQEIDNSENIEADDNFTYFDIDPPSLSESGPTTNGLESANEDQLRSDEKRELTETTQLHNNEASALKNRKPRGYYPSPLVTVKGFDSVVDKKCPNCDLEFAESEYYQHIWDTHARLEDNPQICRKCSEDFTTEDLCHRHYFAKHVDQATTCSICFKTNLGKHAANHVRHCHTNYETLVSDDEQAKTNCPHCKEEFSQNDKIKLFKHIWTNHILTPVSPTICSVCQKECFTQDNYQAHYYLIHFDTNNKCINCLAEGFNKIQLRQHRLEVHKIQRNSKKSLMKQMDKCDFCGDKSFPIASTEYYAHVWKTHVRKSEAPDRCEECDRNYSGEFFAMRHYFHHHYRNDKICDECGKGNFTHHQLLCHKKNHELDRCREKVKCTMCTRTFSSEESYRKHLEFHAIQGTKRFQCKVCSAFFASSASLRNHNRRFHLKAINYNLKKDTLKCRFCNKVFRSKHNLDVHEIVHTRLYPFKCSACGVETVQLENMRLHVMKRHLNNLKATPDEIDMRYVIRQNGAENVKVSQEKEVQHDQNVKD